MVMTLCDPNGETLLVTNGENSDEIWLSGSLWAITGSAGLGLFSASARTFKNRHRTTVVMALPRIRAKGPKQKITSTAVARTMDGTTAAARCKRKVKGTATATMTAAYSRDLVKIKPKRRAAIALTMKAIAASKVKRKVKLTAAFTLKPTFVVRVRPKKETPTAITTPRQTAAVVCKRKVKVKLATFICPKMTVSAAGHNHHKVKAAAKASFEAGTMAGTKRPFKGAAGSAQQVRLLAAGSIKIKRKATGSPKMRSSILGAVKRKVKGTGSLSMHATVQVGYSHPADTQSQLFRVVEVKHIPGSNFAKAKLEALRKPLNR